RKKYEYADSHFKLINKYLAESESAIRYKLNFLTPKNFGAYFQYLREGNILNYTSELDVKLITELGISPNSYKDSASPSS
ncbi:MAG: hypothetical protein AAGU75_11015, partial [Bacillota bacterium]